MNRLAHPSSPPAPPPRTAAAAPLPQRPPPEHTADSPGIDRPRCLVIGNGMVSHRLCKLLVDRGGTSRLRLIVIGEERRPAYDRVHLTSYFQDRDAERLSLAPARWYADHGIDLRLSDPAVAIDREARIVRCASGSQHCYDTLVLATGSAPFVPPVPGVDLPGVHLYRTIEDLDAIDAHAARCRTAVVIGGGLLGLEAAKALDDAGLETYIVEMATHLMPRQLDPAAAAVLEGRIARLGIHIRRGRRIIAIERTPNGLRVRFEGDDHLDVGLVVIAAGIRPRDELARAAGLQSGGGIHVDDAMRTSDPRIFAIGECARHRDSVYGLVGPGYQMAGVVADRLLGGSLTLERPDLSASLKLLGVHVVTLGDYRAHDCRAVTRDHADVRRQLLIRRNRIVGAVAIGEWNEVGRIQEAIHQRRRLSVLAERRFRSTGRLYRPSTAVSHVADWPAAVRVCNCLGVTRGRLSELIDSGCSSVESITDRCGAGGICGSCRPLIASLLGSAAAPVTQGRRALLVASLLAACLVATIAILKPIPFSDSVQSALHGIDALWRDPVWKQTSGFTLLGLTTLGLLLSARKRIKRLRFLHYGWWCAAHGILGSAALIALIVHTGLRLGENLNLALMLCFLGLALAGAATGIASVVEAASTTRAVRARRLRPWLTWAHIVLFWPLPVLIAVHVLRVYLY